MSPIPRRLLVFTLFLLSLLPVGLVAPHFQTIYAFLEQYYVHGLWVSWLGAYILANLCAPSFMYASGSRGEYEKLKPRDIIILYLSVMGITFVALVVVFFVLWFLGWLWLLISLFGYWLKELISERIDRLFGW